MYKDIIRLENEVIKRQDAFAERMSYKGKTTVLCFV